MSVKVDEQPVTLFYEGDNGKPYKPGKSMRRVLAHAWGTDATVYPGRSLTLYRDATDLELPNGVVVPAMLRVGPAGRVAVNVFRAQKASERAKVYHGGRGGRSYRSQAYEKKAWAMDQLCGALEEHATALGLTWGWGEDDKQPVHRHVLYVDLPTGQASWHTGARGRGPTYSGAWDGVVRAVPARLLAWCGRLLDGAEHRGAREPVL